MEFDIKYTLRNPGEEEFQKVLLMDSVKPGSEQYDAVQRLIGASHSNFQGSIFKGKYENRALAGIEYLQAKFEEGDFSFDNFKEFVELTKYGPYTADLRLEEDQSDYHIPSDVIQVLEIIRIQLGFLPKFQIGNNPICEPYEINLPNINLTVKVEPLGRYNLKVGIPPARIVEKFKPAVVSSVNDALLADGLDFLEPAINSIQLIVHMWYTYRGVASRAMNLFNALLVHKGLHPIPHGIFDYASMMMTNEELQLYIRQAVIKFNPEIDRVNS